MIRRRAEENAGGENPPTDIQSPDGEPKDAPAPETPVAPPTQGWSPSQEEWQATQQAIARMAAYFEEDDTPEPPDPNDINAYIGSAVETRLKSDPVYQAAVNERGEKVLNELHDRFEKDLGKKFDRALAKRAAESFANEGGNPHEAVKRGVEYAIEVQEKIETDAVDRYKKSLQRGPHDLEPGATGGGDQSRPKFKSYDEVTEFYAGQTEV
jgi:hypothetical protein